MICVIALLAIPIGLAIGALILLAAIWLANKCLPQPRSRRRYYDDDDDYYEWDAPRRHRRGGTSTAVPVPSFGQAMLIVFVNWIVNFGVGFVIGFVLGAAGAAKNQGGMVLVQAISLAVGFVVSATILSGMLPTSFGRACLVVLFQYLIAIAIAIVIIVPLVIMGVGLAGLK
jgi:hypothetical protein